MLASRHRSHRFAIEIAPTKSGTRQTETRRSGLAREYRFAARVAPTKAARGKPKPVGASSLANKVSQNNKRNTHE